MNDKDLNDYRNEGKEPEEGGGDSRSYPVDDFWAAEGSRDIQSQPDGEATPGAGVVESGDGGGGGRFAGLWVLIGRSD